MIAKMLLSIFLSSSDNKGLKYEDDYHLRRALIVTYAEDGNRKRSHHLRKIWLPCSHFLDGNSSEKWTELTWQMSRPDAKSP